MRAKGRATKRKDGRWRTSVNLPDGTRKYLYGKSQTAVTQAAAKLRRAVEEGEAATEDRRTVEEYLAEWLAAAKLRVKLSSYQKYEALVRRYIAPELGKKRLTRLTADDLERLYVALTARGLAANTVRGLHNVLHNALERAQRRRIVRENVAELVDPPRVPQHEARTLTADQAGAVMAAARDDALEAIWVLALHTGLRIGQILGLRWQDVDLERRRLTVRGTLSKDEDKKRVFSEAKTAASRHQILLTAHAAEALQRRRETQTAERLLAGDAWHSPEGFVFTTKAGRPVEHRVWLFTRHKPLLERAGVAYVKPHELRHSVATLLLGEGVHPRVVADLLGHSRTALTMDTYSHVTESLQQSAIDALARLFSKDGGQHGGQQSEP